MVIVIVGWVAATPFTPRHPRAVQRIGYALPVGGEPALRAVDPDRHITTVDADLLRAMENLYLGERTTNSIGMCSTTLLDVALRSMCAP